MLAAASIREASTIAASWGDKVACCVPLVNRDLARCAEDDGDISAVGESRRSLKRQPFDRCVQTPRRVITLKSVIGPAINRAEALRSAAKANGGEARVRVASAMSFDRQDDPLAVEHGQRPIDAGETARTGRRWRPSPC